MRILPFSETTLDEVIATLRAGGVVAHATETCYGLACDIANIEAVKKLFAIKQRPESQPVSGLFSSAEEAKQYVEWNERAEALAKQYLPGPLTMILPLRADAPTTLHPIADTTQISPTIGVRISSHTHAQTLVEAYGSPLTTTSANLHGQPNPYSAEDIEKQFAAQEFQPDLIVDSGVLPQNPPSTVVDCTTEALEKKRTGSLNV